MDKDEKKKSFRNWKHNAIHLWFPNGNGLSTTWAYGSYSDNHDMDDEVEVEKVWTTFRPSNTVEIMILQAPPKLVRKIHKKYSPDSDDSVIGYLNMEQWLDIVKMLSKPVKEL